MSIILLICCVYYFITDAEADLSVKNDNSLIKLTPLELINSMYTDVYAEDNSIELEEVDIASVVSCESEDELGFFTPSISYKDVYVPLNIDTNNLIFVGNSLVEGLRLCTRTDNVFLCKVGVSFTGLKSKIYKDLQNYSCDNVVIEMGTNELGYWSEDNFKVGYGDLIDHIRDINADSHIFLVSIPPVSERRSLRDNYYNNENVKKYNGYVQDICTEYDVYYIDCTDFFGDVLKSSWTSDGMHLYGSKYTEWYDYIVRKISEL